MKRSTATIGIAALALTVGFAHAGAPTLPQYFEEDMALYDDETKEYYRWESEFLSSLTYQDGLIELPGGKATIQVPENFYYLSPEDSQKILVDAWGNMPSEELTLGMLFPAQYHPLDDLTWGVTIDYQDDGHVSDDDAQKIDYDDMLKDMKADTAESSEWRVQEGYGAIELVGWAATPYYDDIGKKLHWAKEIRFDGAENTTLNYNIRALGREGVLVFNFIAGIEQLEQVENSLDAVLKMPTFTEGNTYADFDPSMDKIAAYGIGGLVAGKVLAKTGLLAAAFLFFKKFFIVFIVGIFAAIKGLFGKKKGN